MTTRIMHQDLLIAGTKEIFETMIFMDIKEAEVQTNPLSEETLLATITFTGDMAGYLGICWEQACGQAVAASMLGINAVDDLSPQDVHDAMGEVCNMVMGCIKTKVSETWGTIQVSIPTVIRGRDRECDQDSHKDPWLLTS